MDETGDRVRHAALAKADMIKAWPDTMWEDVWATNERAGLDRCGAADRTSGAFRLGPEELRAGDELEHAGAGVSLMEVNMELMGRGEWVPGGAMGVPSAAIRRELPRGESSNSARAEDRQEIPQPRPPRPEPAPPEPDPQPPMPKPPV